MSLEYYLLIYVAVGAVGMMIGMYFEFRGKRCPSREDALAQFVLGALLGPLVVMVILVASPLWVPIVLHTEYYEGSRMDLAIKAWWAKPLCKGGRDETA